MSDRTAIAQRMERLAIMSKTDPAEWTDCPHLPGKRWRLDDRWVEFECGCAARRCVRLVNPKPWEPIIFVNLPEQAVYSKCCERHRLMMDYRINMGGGPRDFDTWRRERYRTIRGLTR